MEEQKELDDQIIRRKWLEVVELGDKWQVDLTLNYLVRCAINLHRRYKSSYGVNDFLRDVMHLNAVGCELCDQAWTTGIAGRDAETQEEARIGAHANGWELGNAGVVLCPSCRRKE